MIGIILLYVFRFDLGALGGGGGRVGRDVATSTAFVQYVQYLLHAAPVLRCGDVSSKSLCCV